MSSRLVALKNEGCHDCGYGCISYLLLVPEEINIQEEKAKWETWYREVYLTKMSERSGYVPYVSFVDFLIEKGAVDAPSSMVEYYEDV